MEGEVRAARPCIFRNATGGGIWDTWTSRSPSTILRCIRRCSALNTLWICCRIRKSGNTFAQKTRRTTPTSNSGRLCPHSLLGRDDENAFPGDGNEDVLVARIDGNGVASQRNIGDKLLGGGVHHGHSSTLRGTREVVVVGARIVPDFVGFGPLRHGFSEAPGERIDG